MNADLYLLSFSNPYRKSALLYDELVSERVFTDCIKMNNKSIGI